MEENQESNLETAEDVPEAKNEESSVDSLILFLDKLTQIFDRDLVVLNTKRTEKGVFVSRDFAEKLPEAYQQFLSDLTSGASHKSVEKCKKRLFGSDKPAAYYLFEGKQSVFGWLINVPVNQLGSSDIPHYRGAPVDATDYLHHKDPVFEECDFISAETDRSGFKIFVQSKQKQIELNSTSVTKFGDLVRQSKTLQGYYPKAMVSAREALRALAEALRKARLVKPHKDPFFLPLRLQQEKGVVFLKVGATYFVCSKDWKLVDMFETRGPNLRDLLIQDYEHLIQQGSKTRGSRKNLPNAKFFRLSKRKGAIVGEILTETRRYPLNIHALSDFASRIEKVRPSVKFSKSPYTITLLLDELSARYQQAEKVVSRAKSPKGEQRKSGNLLYALDARSSIRNISLLGEERAVETRAAKGKQKGKRFGRRSKERNRR